MSNLIMRAEPLHYLIFDFFYQSTLLNRAFSECAQLAVNYGTVGFWFVLDLLLWVYLFRFSSVGLLSVPGVLLSVPGVFSL